MKSPLKSVKLPEDLIEEIDRAVDGRYVSNRTAAIRWACQDWLKSRNTTAPPSNP